MGKKWPRNFAESGDIHVTFGFFYIPQSTTWYRRLYFRSEGRRAEDFFRPRNPTAFAGFEPSNLGTKGQHATSRPPKALIIIINILYFVSFACILCSLVTLPPSPFFLCLLVPCFIP
jgi:hypothetical protein